MLEFYFSTVIIWFLIYMASGIVFYKPFKEAQKKLNKKLKKDNATKWNYIKTVLYYLTICFIPVIRLLILWTKFVFIFNTEEVIKRMKELKESVK